MPCEKTQVEFDRIAVENLRTYLRIPSVQPNVDYAECVEFLRRQAADIGLDCEVHEFVPTKPIVVMTWTGKDPRLPSILLNSHMDVVPVYPELWSRDPFAAEMDSSGNIYARGAQDMKSVGIQHVEAVRRMKCRGESFARTIHLTFVPDEEIGGVDGMKTFAKTDAFKKLNVGFGLDEGVPSPAESFALFYAERITWQVEFAIKGAEGHGSLLLANTAGEKLRRLLDSVMDFRRAEYDRLHSTPGLERGDVTSVNLTVVHGGVQSNVLPPELRVTFDFRLAVDVDHERFEEKLRAWTENAGDGVAMKFVQRNDSVPATKLDDANPYWTTMKKTFEEMNITYEAIVCPGATDSRYVRQLGIPVIGFSPINNTRALLHNNNEYVNKDVFLRGIDIFATLLSKLADAAF